MNFKRLRLLRNAARVLRCHNAPAVHRQSVGEHTFGVMGVLATVYPEAPAALWRAALYHDVTESVTGDVPAPTKWRYPSLEAALKEAESKIKQEYDLAIALSSFDKEVLKYCDLMELAIYAIEECDTGNKGMAELARNALHGVVERGLVHLTPATEELWVTMIKECERKGYSDNYGADTTHGTYTAHGK